MQVALAMASLMALIPAIVVGERERTLAELRRERGTVQKPRVGGRSRGFASARNGKIIDVNNQFLENVWL